MTSLGDVLGYLTINNPVSQALIQTGSVALKSIGLVPKKAPVAPPPIDFSQLRLSKIAGKDYPMIQMAGVFGASAVIMGAYGKHALANIDDAKMQLEAKNIFDTANRFHFLHSVTLIGMPLARRPVLTGSLMAIGTLLFSGQMYYRALSGDKKYIKVSTLGGFCLIIAWLSLIF